eukprot:m.162617 g.162617  ORF g.162617 m.162617 type:complete len:89 (-) comp14378_c0_seq4:4145-4411(-)
MQTVASKTPASVADANTPPKQGDSHQPILVGNLSKRAQGRSTFGRTNWKTRYAPKGTRSPPTMPFLLFARGMFDSPIAITVLCCCCHV